MKLLKIFLPPIVLAVCGLLAWLLIHSKEEPLRREPRSNTTEVEALRLRRQDYTVVLQSQGTVKARTESTLIPEISGRIVKISPAFRSGKFFEEGDILLQIDSRDHKTALTVAEATLTQAQLSLAEEEARVEQALKDWEKLGSGEKPGPLVLRTPQLAEARGSVDSAQARLEQAQRDLERTRIAAPYAGRILEKRVDVGQYVTPGTILALLYAVDYAEIRLPLSNRQLSFINLPELYRGETEVADKDSPKVLLKAQFGEDEFSWAGNIVRTEGSIDTASRQLYVVAQVKNPYGRLQSDHPPLKVGMFVKSEIMGKTLKNVFVLPRSALREGRDLLLIDKDNRLERRPVDILWSDRNHIIVGDSLKDGELLCLTALSFAAEGAPVSPRVQGEETATSDQPKGRTKGPS